MTSTTAHPEAPETQTADEACPRCGKPPASGAHGPHRLSDDEARELGARPGLYHDECCPECNGPVG